MNISAKIQFLKSLRHGSVKVLMDSELPEIDWFVDKVVPEGMITTLYGPSQQFKSTFGLYLAICIASGNDTFFYKTIKQGNILWIDEEMGLKGLKRKVNQLAKGLNVSSDVLDNKFIYCSMMGLKLDSKEGVDFLKSYILLKDIKVIFVDSMSKVIDGDENKTQDMSKFLHNLRMISDELGIAFVFIHHIGKSAERHGLNAMRGSSEFVNQIDYAFRFDKVGDGKVKMSQEKNRYDEQMEGINFHVCVEDDSMLLSYVGLAKDETKKMSEQRFKDAMKKILDYFIAKRFPVYKIKELVKDVRLPEWLVRDVIYKNDDSLHKQAVVKYDFKGNIWFLGEQKNE